MKKLYLVMLVMFFVCFIVSASVFAVTSDYNSVTPGNTTASSIANTLTGNNVGAANNTIGGNTLPNNVVGSTNTTTGNILTTDPALNTLTPDAEQNTITSQPTTEQTTNGDVSASVDSVTDTSSSAGLSTSDIINILIIVVGVVIILLGIAVIIRLKQ